MKQMQIEEEMKLLKKYKINLAPSLVVSAGESLKAADKVKFPVVVKVADSFVVHKSDCGAVVKDIRNKTELISAIKVIKDNVHHKYKKKPHKFLIQKMIKGTELIIGMKRNSSFGPVIMFGLGGIFVEVYKDVSFKVAPVGKREATKMLSEIKGKPILDGARGNKVSKDAIIDLITKVSKMVMENEEILEMDFNPVIVDQFHAYVADVRMMQ